VEPIFIPTAHVTTSAVFKELY